MDAKSTTEANEPVVHPDADPLLQFFNFRHLPPALQEVSRKFCALASLIVAELPSNAERTVALRKLLEAKDCAVRAVLFVAPKQGSPSRGEHAERAARPGLLHDAGPALDELERWCRRIAEDAGCWPPEAQLKTLRAALSGSENGGGV
jgi:hypothetical protein